MSFNEKYEKQFEGFDDYVDQVMTDWKIPGYAISAVMDGETVFSKGYGFRDPDKKLEMNADTLYRIASNTKAFVSASLAILADEGKLDWDKPIVEYIPYFKLKDNYASDKINARDLLSHRTGLPAHDGAFNHLKTRKEMVEHLKYLDASYPMRTKLQYNNIMYMVAGHLVECITGQTWECFLQEKILKPLGMEKTNFSFFKSKLSANFAECFYEKDGEVKKYDWKKDVDPEYIFPRCPAGGINTTANEMIHWLNLQLNKGEFNGNRIISETQFKQMHSPTMIDNWESPYEELGRSACGMGWFLWYYRGHKIVLHGGFFGSQVLLIPDKKIGIASLPTISGEANNIISFNIIDRLLGLEPIDWNSRKKEEVEKNRIISAGNKTSGKKEGTVPSHLLSDFCGIYEEKAYGRLSIVMDGSKLYLDKQDNKLEVRHYHYDTFEVLDNEGDSMFKITFSTDINGEVKSILAPFVEGINDIEFVKTKE
jgi:CubicO group peptidase (beta-lactamase class C family)